VRALRAGAIALALARQRLETRRDMVRSASNNCQAPKRDQV